MSTSRNRELLGLPLKSKTIQSQKKRGGRKSIKSAEDRIIRDIIMDDIKELIDLEIEREIQLAKEESLRCNLKFIREFNESFK